MDTENIIQNIIPHVLSFWNLLIVGFQVFGVSIFATGIFLCGQDKSKHQQGGFRRGAGCILAGLILMNCTLFLDVFSVTLFNQESIDESSKILSYDEEDSKGLTDSTEIYFVFAIAVVTITGLASFGKGGWLIHKAAADPNVSYFQAITHLIGGTIAINITVFMEFLANTLGGSIGKSIHSILEATGFK